MSLRDDPVARSAYAGVLAAGTAIVSKRTPGHRPPAVPPPAGYLPATLPDTPRLLADAKPIDRITAAALCHAYEARDDGSGLRPGGYAERLLTGDERRAFKVHVDSNKVMPECRYCDLFHSLSHASTTEKRPRQKLPQTAVVNHSAIKTTFDPDGSNVSTARIDNFQLVLPKQSAMQVLGRSHPLNWKKAAPDIFDSVVPARLDPHQLWEPDPDTSPVEWQDKAQKEKLAFIRETASWPWSEDVTLGVVNVIRVENLESTLPLNGDLSLRLSYQYHLESCLRSDYGFITEEFSGLDIDDGEYVGEAVPVREIRDEHVQHLTKEDLTDLAQRRQLDPRPFQRMNGSLKKKRELVQNLFAEIGKQGKYDPWLLTITTSKALRYTVPQYVSVDLWATLTWMAPALLFTFMNKAVCQLPQFVDEEIRTGKSLKLTIGTTP